MAEKNIMNELLAVRVGWPQPTRRAVAVATSPLEEIASCRSRGTAWAAPALRHCVRGAAWAAPTLRRPLRAVALTLALLAPFAQAAELEIADGVVVKFGADAELVVRDRLTAGRNILFTSARDDAALSRLGAEAEAPAKGDWRGIRFEASAAAFTQTFGELTVRYSGARDGAGVTLRGFTPSLPSLQLTDNRIGLRVLDGAAPNLTGARFARNGIGLQASTQASFSVTDSIFESHSEQAVDNRNPPAQITATGNWWGDASGPKQATDNPAGQGDAVGEGVNYADWLTAAPLVDPKLRPAENRSYYETDSIDFTLACYGATEYRLAENGDFSGVVFQPLPETGKASSHAFSAGDGRKQISAQFRNAAGTLTTVALPGGVLIDTEAPALAITNPAEGSVLNRAITVEAAASDGAGVQHVRFHVDGALQATDTAAPYAYEWDVEASAEGAHVLRVVATDTAGRTTEALRNVTVTLLPPEPDTAGPTLGNFKLDSVTLGNGATLTKNATVSLDATDRSGVSRVELLMDDALMSTAALSGTRYSAALILNDVANGAHVLTLRAYDSLNNASRQDFDVTVAHAVPAAPTFAEPANGTSTRYADIAVSGNAAVGSTVRLYVNDIPAGEPVTAGAAGAFRTTLTLGNGINKLQATASNAYGTSVKSGAVTVTVDTSLPAAPAALTAAALAGGTIRLSWARPSDANVTGYHLYRATAPFATPGEALRINAGKLAATSYDDMPPGDGTYYYRVVSVNSIDTPSEPGNLAQARADATPPRASVAYGPKGKVDPVTGRIGQGRVDLVVTVSEPLSAAPYLAIVPQGGLPLTLDLARQDDTHYAGGFTIGPDTPSGEAHALFSARDLIGNRGTEITSGATLRIDTTGPVVTGIAITPASPIRNEPARTVSAVFTLDHPVRPGTAPALAYLLSGPVRSQVALGGVTQTGPTAWSGSFTLPADAGLVAPENFSFIYQGVDDLDNVSTRISAANRFQVYQGDLPPLAAPLNFKAQAQPGGKVKLSWSAVDEAFAYQLYRQGPAEPTLAALIRTGGTEHVDQTPADGDYKYAVATVRQENGQESVSAMSQEASARASATAPGAPQNLSLALAGKGIVATWQAPAGAAPASYKLYRSSAAAITSVEGLTPIKTGIKTLGTVDANPSPTDHAYVATALDAAGNESAPSNSAYLNFTLLPVAGLKAEQADDGQPTVSWTATLSGAAGYDVYAGEEGSRVKLNDGGLVAGLAFTDNAFTTGERLYTVVAVDNNGAEMARSLLLPHVAAQIVSGLPVKRGILNKLRVQVANLSATPLASLKVAARIGPYAHASAPFALAPSETRLVDVIVGGHHDLANPSMLELAVESTPNEGELARVVRSQSVEVSDAALAIGLATENFTRGATGLVRITVENTSEVDVEILTARANGSQDSNEIRFKLFDADDNLLAAQAYRQVFGAGVVTLPSGETVARIPAGQSYTSEAFSLKVPASAPPTVRVRLEVDKLHYHTGQPDGISIQGKGAETTASLVDTAYTGEVSSVAPLSSFGDQDIVIQGRALDRATAAPLSNAALKLVFNQSGFERVFPVTTDAAGAFAYTFKPTITDSGLIQVAALHPAMTDRPVHAQFTLSRVTVSPALYKLAIPRNYAHTIQYTARAGAGTNATGVRLETRAASQVGGSPVLGVELTLPAPVALASRQSVTLPVRLVFDNGAQPSGSLILDVLANEHGEAPIGKVRIDYTLVSAEPYLVPTPSFIEAGMAQGGTVLETVTLENKGVLAVTDLKASLTDNAGGAPPAWASLATSPNLGNLDVGEKRTLDLAFAPGANVPEGVYAMKLRVEGANFPERTLNVFASITQSGVGNVLFKAADLYTATLDKNGNLIPGLAGVRIKVQNEAVPGILHELVTDGLGEALFQNLPAGYYQYRASAADHQETGGRFQVKPGLTVNQGVFLDYNLVTVEWSVREVTLQDRYEITLTATYETDVPGAVLVLEPAGVNLPQMEVGEVYYGELTLTNYGLIRAENVRQTLPASDGYFKFEFLDEPPASLEAKQRVTIPYRVIALKSFEPDGAASGGGCYSYSNRLVVSAEYQCANGEWSQTGTTTHWFSSSSSTCTTPPHNPDEGDIDFGGGDLPWGGPGGPTSPLTGMPSCVSCKGKCCLGPGAGAGGSGSGGAGNGGGPGSGSGDAPRYLGH